MRSSDFRIESAYPIVGPFVPKAGRMAHLLNDRELAVVVAAKSETYPAGQEIRVVHVPSGEIIFSKSAATPLGAGSTAYIPVDAPMNAESRQSSPHTG